MTSLTAGLHVGTRVFDTIDMNGTTLSGLPLATTDTEPVRLLEFNTLTSVVNRQTDMEVVDMFDFSANGWVYANGDAGNGATLTAPTDGQYDPDGVDMSTDTRFIIAGNTAVEYNGIYNRTTAGSVGVNASFTRSPDANGNPLYTLQRGTILAVISGTYTNTIWSQTSVQPTVMGAAGTGDIIYNQMSINNDNLINPAVTTYSVNNTGTYDNGVSGVDATITRPAIADPVIIDGYSMAIGDSTIFNGSINQAQNGIYELTTVTFPGNEVWTRRADVNGTPISGLRQGLTFYIIEGIEFGGVQFSQISEQPVDIGTDPIEFAITANPTTHFLDNVFQIQNSVDNTKVMRFDTSAINTATTHVYTLPNNDGIIALTSDIPTSIVIEVVDTSDFVGALGWSYSNEPL